MPGRPAAGEGEVHSHDGPIGADRAERLGRAARPSAKRRAPGVAHCCRSWQGIGRTAWRRMSAPALRSGSNKEACVSASAGRVGIRQHIDVGLIWAVNGCVRDKHGTCARMIEQAPTPDRVRAMYSALVGIFWHTRTPAAAAAAVDLAAVLVKLLGGLRFLFSKHDSRSP